MSALKIEGQGFNRAVTLNSYRIPMFGLGTFPGYSKSDPEKARNATVIALQFGYRLLDSAVRYENEKEVGEGIKKSGIKREDIFVVTKLPTFAKTLGYDAAIKGVRSSLEKLDTGYIDLMLIHTPFADNILETYDGLLKMKEEGLVRSVGVSNFGIHHLEEMRKAGKPTPAVNQIELNCFWRNQDVVKYCHKHGIAVMGYRPMSQNKKSDHIVLVNMAKRYNKTVAQIMIRWSFQKDYITIPKSSNPERIVENGNIFDFVISDEDMEKLDSLPTERSAFSGREDPIDSPWLG